MHNKNIQMFIKNRSNAISYFDTHIRQSFATRACNCNKLLIPSTIPICVIPISCVCKLILKIFFKIICVKEKIMIIF